MCRSTMPMALCLPNRLSSAYWGNKVCGNSIIDMCQFGLVAGDLIA